MKQFVIFNWKEGKMLNFDFEFVDRLEDAWVYDEEQDAKSEIESRGEPFCKVVDVEQLHKEILKTKAYKELGGVDLYSLKYGQKFKVLQKGWENRTFVFQPQEKQPNGDYIYLYEFENYKGRKVKISGEIASALKVEIC